MPYIINIRTIFLLSILFSTGCNSSASVNELAEPSSGIAFVSDRSGNWDIYLADLEVGHVSQLTDHPSVDSDPDWSADGRQIAFRSRRDGSSDIFIMGADGSQPINLINDPAESFNDEFAPKWHPEGQIFSLYTDRFLPRGNCLAGFHQLAFLRTNGDEPEFDLFETIPGEQYSSSWSPDGRFLVFNSSCRGENFRLYLYDLHTGDTSLLSTKQDSQTYPAWSHDGRFLAISANLEDNNDIYVLELETNNLAQLTSHPSKDTQPTWSPDDSQIAFVTNRDGNQEIYVMDADGSNLYNLTRNPANDWYPAWSPVE